MWFDSHCHLHIVEEESPLGDVVAQAEAAEVGSMLVVGTDVESSVRAAQIADQYGLWASAGVHPNSADGWDADAHRAIVELLGHERVVAVGETGLDNYWDMVDPGVQMEAFRAHIELAKSYDKALVIHTRRSTTQALDALQDQEPPERFIFHCWQGKPGELDRALEMGAYVSFAGNAWSKKNARKVPPDRLLIETDSPYLTPDRFRGAPNRPAYVVAVGESIAEVRDEPAADIARITTENARTVFGLSE